MRIDTPSSVSSSRCSASTSGALAWGQGRNIGFEWQATSADAQRTGWLRLDPNIAPDTRQGAGLPAAVAGEAAGHAAAGPGACCRA